jgi:hypothetical protein
LQHAVVAVVAGDHRFAVEHVDMYLGPFAGGVIVVTRTV